MAELVSCNGCQTYFRGNRCPRCGLALDGSLESPAPKEPDPPPATFPQAAITALPPPIAPTKPVFRPFLDDIGTNLPPPPAPVFEPPEPSYENKAREELIIGLSAVPLALATGHMSPAIGALGAVSVIGALGTKLPARLVPFFAASVVIVGQVVAIGWITVSQLRAGQAPEWMNTITAVIITLGARSLLRVPKINRAAWCLAIEVMLVFPVIISAAFPDGKDIAGLRPHHVHQLLVIAYASALLIRGMMRVSRMEAQSEPT